MELSCRPDNGIRTAVVASPSGYLDVDGATVLWEQVTANLGEDTPSLMVDMSEVELITSAGVGILVRLLHRVQSLAGKMVVFACSKRVRSVIEVVMLAEVFKLCDTLEQAREKLTD
jgi:anti-anti-sigma factor